MIAIINHGVGNLRSVLCALNRLGVEASLVSDASGVRRCEGIILPGVGAFSAAMNELSERDLSAILIDEARRGKPLLGICVGHQLLFSGSTEHGTHTGLDLVPGSVKRFAPGLKIPHMGWNRVKLAKDSVLFEGIDDNSYFYFAHSYYGEPADGLAAAATTDYGPGFVSCVACDNVFGVQFHPEKSGAQGLQVLLNFCRYSGC